MAHCGTCVSEVPHWDFDRVVREGTGSLAEELGPHRRSPATDPKCSRTSTLRCTTPASRPPCTRMWMGSTAGWTRTSTRPRIHEPHHLLALGYLPRLASAVQHHPTRAFQDLINSMLAHYDQSAHHMLPIWSHHANENWCMIGYHAVSVIADAQERASQDSTRSDMHWTHAWPPHATGAMMDFGAYMDLGLCS
jgi:hypothetical protein